LYLFLDFGAVTCAAVTCHLLNLKLSLVYGGERRKLIANPALHEPSAIPALHEPITSPSQYVGERARVKTCASPRRGLGGRGRTAGQPAGWQRRGVLGGRGGGRRARARARGATGPMMTTDQGA